MILPRGFPGAAFGTSADGDPRRDPASKRTISRSFGVPENWAFVDQIHGHDISVATTSGSLGQADGIVTSAENLPIAVTTADCVPVVLRGSMSVAVVHAGWRGLSTGVVLSAVRSIKEIGDTVVAAAIGPHIGPCCYEVGPEVVAAVGGHGATTTSGAESVDLAAAIKAQIPTVPTSVVDMCTMHDARFHSFRRNATSQRQVTVAWIQQD